MRIDVHAHYWAGEYINALVEAGRHDLRMAGRQRDDLDQRLAEMDTVAVDVQLFSAIGLNTEVADADTAETVSGVINGVYDDLFDRYQGRFRGYASVPLPHVTEAVRITDRVLDNPGIVGLALPCIVGGLPLDHEDYGAFWRHLGERGDQVVVYVHPVGSDSNLHPGLESYGLNMLLGSTTQVAMAALRVGLSGITTLFPNIQFVFALCGGVLPYLWQRYERNLRRGIEMSAVAAVGKGMFAWMDAVPIDPDDPMELFTRNVWFDTSVQDIPSALRLGKETYGSARMLLGSDAIFASLTESVYTIETSSDLTVEEKRAILDVNAEQLFGFEHEVNP